MGWSAYGWAQGRLTVLCDVHSAADIALYRDTMAAAGYDEPAIECSLDQIWVWREMHLADTDRQAMDEFLPAQHQAYSIMPDYRQRLNPKEFPMSQQSPPMLKDGYGPYPNSDALEKPGRQPRPRRRANPLYAAGRHPQPHAHQPRPDARAHCQPLPPANDRKSNALFRLT